MPNSAPTPMTAEEIAKIRERCKNATKYISWWDVPAYRVGSNDTTFDYHARTDVPRLLAEVERQAGEIDRLGAKLKEQALGFGKAIVLKDAEIATLIDECDRLRGQLKELPGRIATILTHDFGCLAYSTIEQIRALVTEAAALAEGEAEGEKR